MAIVHNPKGYSFFNIVLTGFLRKSYHASSSSKKAEEIVDARYFGYYEGIVEGMTAYAGGLRIEKVQELLEGLVQDDAWVEVPQYHAVWLWLQQLRKAWDEDVFKDTDDETFFPLIHEQFMDAVVWPEEFQKLWMHERKQLVLAQKIEPSEMDAEWIRNDLAAQEDATSPLRKLNEKLNS